MTPLWVDLVIWAGPVACAVLGWYARALWHHGRCELLQDEAYDDGWDDCLDRVRSQTGQAATWDGPPPDPEPAASVPAAACDGEQTQAWPAPAAWPDPPQVISEETIARWGELTTAAIEAYAAEYEALAAR